MHYQGSAVDAFQSVEHIMRECALVSLIESVVSTTPIILGSLLGMVTFKYHDPCESNKPREWIAIWERVGQFIPE